MDLDIAKNLSQLQAKKLAIETGTDLTGHCDTWIELNDRIVNLVEEVKKIRVELDERFGFMDHKWDQLGPAYRTLQRADKVQDLVIELNQLNSLCKRLETNSNLIRSKDGTKLYIKSMPRLMNGNEENIDLESDDQTTLHMVSDLLESFENTYKPLEEILSKRNDLPYARYATQVRELKESINKIQTLKSK